MKLARTLKVEIIRAETEDSNALWGRIRALTDTLGPALNLLMRQAHPQATEEIRARRRKEKPDTTWQNTLSKHLRLYWGEELGNALAYRQSAHTKNKKLNGKSGKTYNEPDARYFLPVKDEMSSATIDLVKSRFSGNHLTDLIRAKASFPSWGGDVPFYASARSCSIEGAVGEARLTFPLWGTGTKATRLIVAPSGGHACATWNRLVRDFGRRRELMDLEQSVKEARIARSAAVKAHGKGSTQELEIKEKIEALQSTLGEMGVYKLGKVGIKLDRKRKKLYALISWTSYQKDEEVEQQKAAAINFGINVFMQCLAEDGKTWQHAGQDLIAIREKFSNVRYNIQKCMNNFGKGSKGRGKKRRELPLTKKTDKESRCIESRGRQRAAELIKWCRRHSITDLYLDNLKGIRDEFENETEGDAPEQLKRLMHNWPYYKETLYITQEASEHGIKVHQVPVPLHSQRCPICGFTSHTNVIQVRRHRVASAKHIEVRRAPGASSTEEPLLWRAIQSFTEFRCANPEGCGFRAPGDLVTCANTLAANGHKHSMEKKREKSRKRKGFKNPRTKREEKETI